MSTWNKIKKGATIKNVANPGSLFGSKHDNLFKTAMDPTGIGLGDAVFGKNKPTDYSAYEDEQQAAIDAQKAAYEEFIAGGAANYQSGAPLTFEEFTAGNPLAFQDYMAGEKLNYETLDPNDLARLGNSSFDDITTDSRYADAEIAALQSLEDRMNGSGLTLQDEADMARLNSQVNTQNRGRLGAIKENMASRGMSGSGMDLLAQLQASQDATEMQAYQSLEQSAQAQNQKRQAAIDAGNMGSRLRGQEFQEDAAKAQARDTISRFNTEHMIGLQNKNVDTRNMGQQQNVQRGWQTSDRNTEGRNQTSQDNTRREWATGDRNTDGRNQTSQDNTRRQWATGDRNTDAGYEFRKDKLGAQNQTASNQYNYSTDAENRKRMLEQQARQEQSDKHGAAVGTVGGVFGGIFGGPAGAQAGYGMGKSAGGVSGGTAYDNGYKYYAHGGMIHGDSYENDDIAIMASEGEIMIPRSIADDPVKASEFVAEENGQEMDAVGHLLAAMQLMNRKK